MSTRGAIGFRIDGIDKLTYNHSDSYPSGLGVEFVNQVKALLKDPELKNKVRALADIGEAKPTPEDIERCKPYTDLGVSRQSIDDWYCLMRLAQGNLTAILECGKATFMNDFIIDSLFCEYAYILNLDEGKAEFYAGFNRAPSDRGRYAKLTNDKEKKYYGCKLIIAPPMDQIPEDWKAEFEKVKNAEKDPEIEDN
jgi:hypothetical protein